MARKLVLQTADGPSLWGITQGLNRSVPKTRIEELGLDEAWNVRIEDGILRPRPGLIASSHFARSNPSNYPITHLGEVANYFFPGQNLYYRTLFDSFTSMVSFQYWTGVWNTPAITGAGITNSSLDAPPKTAQFKNELILLTGEGSLFRWLPFSTLDTLDALSPDPSLRPPSNAKFLAATGSRVFCGDAVDTAGGGRVPNRVWWTTTGNSAIWSNGQKTPDSGSSGFETLQHDTRALSGMIFHSGQQLIVFKEWSTYFARWIGSPAWYTFIPVSTRIGCVSDETAQQWRDRVIFLAADFNIYAIDVRGNIVAIGDKIQNYLCKIVDVDNANRSRAFVDPIRNLYWLFVPSVNHAGQFGRHIFCLNLETGAWTEGAFVSADFEIYSCLAARPPNELPYFLLGSANGDLLEFNDTAPMLDTNIGFNAYVWSRVYDLMESLQNTAETGETHKMSIHGQTGRARPRVRSARTLPELAGNVTNFDYINMSGAVPESYTSERTQAGRFNQWGIEWEAEDDDPLLVEGVTPWMEARAQAR